MSLSDRVLRLERHRGTPSQRAVWLGQQQYAETGTLPDDERVAALVLRIEQFLRATAETIPDGPA